MKKASALLFATATLVLAEGCNNHRKFEYQVVNNISEVNRLADQGYEVDKYIVNEISGTQTHYDYFLMKRPK